MKRAIRKLESTRGASIIVALLVLLICMTAGAAALTAASANAGRYTHMARDQQRYLAVSSAAKLVRGELCGSTFTASAEMVENLGVDPDLPGAEPFKLEVTAGSYDGAFKPWLGGDLEALFQSSIPEEWWTQAGWDAPDGADGARYTGLGVQTTGDEPLLDQVKWELELEEDYTLTARFWLEDDGARYYPTVLTLPATVEETTSEPERDGVGQKWRTTKTLTVSWDEADAVITQS